MMYFLKLQISLKSTSQTESKKLKLIMSTAGLTETRRISQTVLGPIIWLLISCHLHYLREAYHMQTLILFEGNEWNGMK